MSKTDRYDLTGGSIFQKLLWLALPIMGGNFVQMAYNLTDMFWLGRLGSEAVAASGTVGIYLWLSMATMNYGNKGAEIGVSQNLGRGDVAAARGYAQSALGLGTLLGVLFAAFLMIFRTPLVGFFAIQEAAVVQAAESYLLIVGLGIPLNYISMAVMGCFSGSGNTVTPFYINLISLAINIVLDPILIFPAGLGIQGAAIATVLAQAVNALLMLIALKKYQHEAFVGFKLFTLPRWRHVKQIFSWATPIAVESFFFTFLSMLISRFVAAFGAQAMAAQRVGSQVESLSWLIAGGYGSAFTAFVGQNYGAGRWGRIRRGFKISSLAMGGWGIFVTVALLLGAGGIFRLFLPNDPGAAVIGAEYLRILAACQLLGCLEPIAAGAFRGLGNTLPPSVISIGVNALRVALAWGLSRTSLGITGIWVAIAAGAAVRSALTYVFYLFAQRKHPRVDTETSLRTEKTAVK